MTKIKITLQQMKLVLRSPIHQSAIVVARQVTRVPTVLKITLVQETNGLLNVLASRRERRNDEDDVSVESNATGTSNRSRRAWSGVPIILMNDIKHESLKNVITLDNGSTLSLFFNPDMVEDIKKTTEVLELHANAGTARCNQKAFVLNLVKCVLIEMQLPTFLGLKTL